MQRGDTEYGLGAIPLGGYVKHHRHGAAAHVATSRTSLAAVQEAARNRDPDAATCWRRRTPGSDAALGGDDQRDLVATVEELRAALERDAELIDPERMTWARRSSTGCATTPTGAPTGASRCGSGS